MEPKKLHMKHNVGGFTKYLFACRHRQHLHVIRLMDYNYFCPLVALQAKL